MHVQFRYIISVPHEIQFQQTTTRTLTLHKRAATSAAMVRFLCKIKDKTSDSQERCFMVERHVQTE